MEDVRREGKVKNEGYVRRGGEVGKEGDVRRGGEDGREGEEVREPLAKKAREQGSLGEGWEKASPDKCKEGKVIEVGQKKEGW